jgi:hypothetical protein
MTPEILMGWGLVGRLRASQRIVTVIIVFMVKLN